MTERQSAPVCQREIDVDIAYLQRRLSQSRAMVQAARSKTARLSHQGLVRAYEALLAKRGVSPDRLREPSPSTSPSTREGAAAEIDFASTVSKSTATGDAKP